MKNLMLAMLAFATLYWHGTNVEIKQYDKARVVCGEFKGEVGYINYAWKDGHVDLIERYKPNAEDLLDMIEFDVNNPDPNAGPRHWYIRDHKCLEQVK